MLKKRSKRTRKFKLENFIRKNYKLQRGFISKLKFNLKAKGPQKLLSDRMRGFLNYLLIFVGYILNTYLYFK